MHSINALNRQQLNLLAFSSLIGLLLLGRIGVGQIASEHQQIIKILLKISLSVGCLIYMLYTKILSNVTPLKNPIVVAIFSVLLIVLSHNVVQTGLMNKGITYSFWQIVIYSVNNVATGLFEELIFRLLLFLTILEYFPTRSSLWLVSYTSLFFGMMHFTSFFDKTDPFSVVNQMIFAFGLGLVLQSLLIWSGNIILVIVLHACINHIGSYETYFQLLESSKSGSSSLSHFISNVIFFLLVILLFVLPLCLILLKKNRLYISGSILK